MSKMTEMNATKCMCPRWGRCKAEKTCPIPDYTAVPGGGLFTPIIPEGCHCARFPITVNKFQCMKCNAVVDESDAEDCDDCGLVLCTKCLNDPNHEGVQ